MRNEPTLLLCFASAAVPCLLIVILASTKRLTALPRHQARGPERSSEHFDGHLEYF